MSADTLAPSGGSSADVLFTAALRGEPCQVVGLTARPHPLPTHAWRDAADVSDLAMLGHCVGATLDIGCGPGRMSQTLAARGACVLGIDVVPEAVALTRARGASALVRDVFGPVPGEGRWDTALLADGNIGIGGDPVSLLRRVHDLLLPSGRAVVEVARPGVGMRTVSLALVCAGARSTPFPWSVVGVDAVREVAAAASMTVRELVEYGGPLGRRTRSPTVMPAAVKAPIGLVARPVGDVRRLGGPRHGGFRASATTVTAARGWPRGATPTSAGRRLPVPAPEA